MQIDRVDVAFPRPSPEDRPKLGELVEVPPDRPLAIGQAGNAAQSFYKMADGDALSELSEVDRMAVEGLHDRANSVDIPNYRYSLLEKA